PKAGGPQYLSRLVTTGEEAENATGQCPLPGADRQEQAMYSPGAAPTSGRSWARRDLNERVSILRQFLASYARRPDDNPLILEHTLAAVREQLRFAVGLLAAPRILPGPTGESNSLHLEPRGCLLLVLDDDRYNGEYLMAAVSALVAGNSVIGVATQELLPEWQPLVQSMTAAGLPDSLFCLQPMAAARELLQDTALAGAMVHARSRHLHTVAQILATRDGPILPLISCVTPSTLLQQTMLEKSVSIDTTAAGGNASLMTMAS
ncbi:MAG: hypothetical protein RLP45_08280, partial [Haliea sp.]